MQRPSSVEQVTESQNNHKKPPLPPPKPDIKQEGKRRYKRVIIALIAAGLLGVGTFAYRTYQNAQPRTDAIAEITVPVDTQTLTVRIQASGTVRPIQSVNLSPKTTGRIAQLYVEQGDQVEAGAIIARMESEDVEAQRLQAAARLEQAEARLAQLRAGNRPQEIAQARARLAQAEARLDQLRAGNRPQEILQARARLAQAQARLDQLRAGNRSQEVAQARARLAQAEARLAQLRAGNRPQEVAQARARLTQAQARLDALRSGSRQDEIAQAETQIEEAEATLSLTAERVRRNQELVNEGAISRDRFDEVVTENRRAQTTLERSQQRLEQLIRARQEAIIEAEAQVTEARQALELQASGARPEEITRAEAEVAEARLALEVQEIGTRPEEILRAEAEVAEARQGVDIQESGARPEEITRAEAEVMEAQQALLVQQSGARPEEIRRVEAEVREAQAQLRGVEVQEEDTIIRAPFAGQITQRYATEGSFVAPTTAASSAGSATSTSIVALARGLEILAQVPEADISRIRSGQQVEIRADAYPDEQFLGKVNLIAPEAIRQQDVTLFEVRVNLESGTETLQSGMNVDVTFLGDQLDNALVVPTVAIVTNRGETGVLIPNAEGKAEFRSVTIGPTLGNQIQILEGLNPGDRVFIGLPEGQELEDILK
ncbi:efflux RND transporter periplasmic adaptor subunit [Oscillatoria acuminata]|uniref:RND family efflux transporter, MFP subunit n=1 Tax=Oscillatoria acuminata PCC 6304 TaxID=56110 RepID=K9TL92_9CYAN|nr:efflux RND transporter periplasmic adaptor subunit [Oscillatoria acuminata]AFY82916.1 RND family efflux transporter, MFP subunit [Oscillatoria acuminata PCC 6304]